MSILGLVIAEARSRRRSKNSCDYWQYIALDVGIAQFYLSSKKEKKNHSLVSTKHLMFYSLLLFSKLYHYQGVSDRFLSLEYHLWSRIPVLFITVMSCLCKSLAFFKQGSSHKISYEYFHEKLMLLLKNYFLHQLIVGWAFSLLKRENWLFHMLMSRFRK